jgi:cytochrome bd ubiquinol oxidase subunit I
MPDQTGSHEVIVPEAETRGDMRKIWGLLIALAVFLLYIMFFIVPQQAAFTPSSEIYADKLANGSPLYTEQIPIQTGDLGQYGRSIFIAFVMEAHVVFADLHLGGSWIILSLILLWFILKQKQYLHLGRSMALFNLILFSVGATFPIAGLLFFISLFPAFTTNVFTVYWWPLLLETILFGAEIFFIYFLWFSWGHVKNGWTALLAVLYAVDVFFQTFAINTIVAGMLTPSATGATTLAWNHVAEGYFLMPISNYLDYWFNPTFWQIEFHRVPAAASAYGFIIAFIAAVHLWRRKDPQSRRFWDWAAAFGIFWGLLGLAFQPITGISYMFQIMTYQYPAFNMIMTGPRGWEMLTLVGLVSILIITVIVYLIESRWSMLRKGENRWMRWSFYGIFGVMAVVMFVLINPAWIGGTIHDDSPGAIVNPLGQMYWKHISIIFMMASVLALIAIEGWLFMKKRGIVWGRLSYSSRWAAAIAGVIGSMVVLVMGYVRESARAPWLLYGVVPVPDSARFPTPIPMQIEFTLWAIILAFAYVVFYYTSKMTAEHPEELEKI